MTTQELRDYRKEQLALAEVVMPDKDPLRSWAIQWLVIERGCLNSLKT